MTKIKNFLKNEIVLAVSFLLCIISMLFVLPNKNYFSYIDYKTILVLFCLMAAMAGFIKIHVFDFLANLMLSKIKKLRWLYLTLILSTFFSSMFITNDVSLIVFVPFTIITLDLINKKDKLVFIVIMETIGANLGSMLTPIGNPQNLFLFSKFNMNLSSFFKTILPFSALSLTVLIIFSLLIKNENISTQKNDIKTGFDKKALIVYCGISILSVLSVFKIINFYITFLIVIFTAIIFDRKIFLSVDYGLLLTFIFLFIFIGNLQNIDIISSFLQKIVLGKEVIVGVVLSQFILNVPASVLLSSFTKNASSLLIGVNIGGLGTLIASMASIISYKFVLKENIKPSKYIFYFTIYNIVFLILSLALYVIIK